MTTRVPHSLRLVSVGERVPPAVGDLKAKGAQPEKIEGGLISVAVGPIPRFSSSLFPAPVMLSWWQFLLLGPSLGAGADTTVLSFLTLPTFAALLISSLIFFAGLHYLLKAYLPFPSRFTADDRLSALAWAGAFAHHVPVCVLAVVTLGVAFFAPGLPPVPLWVLAWSVPFTFAYVIADTVVTCIPQLLRSPPEYEMTLHHVLGLVVTCAALFGPPELLRACFWGGPPRKRKRKNPPSPPPPQTNSPCHPPLPHSPFFPPPSQAGRPTCGYASCRTWGWA
jgi:hypothetical protein